MIGFGKDNEELGGIIAPFMLGLADDRYPGPLTHYGVYCEDHLLDVITNAEPTVRRMSAGEIETWGFFRDDCR